MSNPRVLCIDDCQDTLDLLKTSLEKEFEVFCVADPERVHAALEIVEPDAVILDLMMPKVSGFEVLDSIAARPGPGRGIPYIILSAKKNVEDQKVAYAKGVRLYLCKPFDPDRLAKNVKMIVAEGKTAGRPKQYKYAELENQFKLRQAFQKSSLGNQMSAVSRMNDTGGRVATPPPDSERKPPKVRWMD